MPTTAWTNVAQDMMTANDEVAMLRYRLRLHAPLAVKTIILESNISHAGFPKPLYMKEALTADEIRRYKVELINVPFSNDVSLNHLATPLSPIRQST